MKKTILLTFTLFCCTAWMAAQSTPSGTPDTSSGQSSSPSSSSAGQSSGSMGSGSETTDPHARRDFLVPTSSQPLVVLSLRIPCLTTGVPCGIWKNTAFLPVIPALIPRSRSLCSGFVTAKGSPQHLADGNAQCS